MPPDVAGDGVSPRCSAAGRFGAGSVTCGVHGIGDAGFDEMSAERRGLCAICGVSDPEHVDHDHRTGWVRGILCFNCNGGLGQFRGDPDYLAGAMST